MYQRGRPFEAAFPDLNELLYRRCDPEHVESGRVLPVAVEQFNLSVLRSRFGDPDHARWDSRVAAKDGIAYVYPDWHVIQFSVSDATVVITPTNPAAQIHSFRPVHDPLADNYAHTELGLFRGEGDGVRLQKSGDAKGAAAKLARAHFRTVVADRARICLHAYEGSSFQQRHDHRRATKRLVLRNGPASNTGRRGVLRSGVIVNVLDVSGRWFRISLSGGSGVEGWVYRRYLRRV
jgi:hypothetical protein